MYKVSYNKCMTLNYVPTKEMMLYDYDGESELCIRLGDKTDIVLMMCTGDVVVDHRIVLADNHSVDALEMSMLAHKLLGWDCVENESEQIKTILFVKQNSLEN